MLTEGQQSADASRVAVAAMELEMLGAIAEAVGEGLGELGRARLMLKIREIARRHLPLIEEAVRRDLTGQLYINGQTELDEAESASGGVTGAL